MRHHDPHTGYPLPTKEEWQRGVTSDNLEDESIMRWLGRFVGFLVGLGVLLAVI